MALFLAGVRVRCHQLHNAQENGTNAQWPTVTHARPTPVPLCFSRALNPLMWCRHPAPGTEIGAALSKPQAGPGHFQLDPILCLAPRCSDFALQALGVAFRPNLQAGPPMRLARAVDITAPWVCHRKMLIYDGIERPIVPATKAGHFNLADI